MKDLLDVGLCIFVALGAYLAVPTKVREKWLPIAFAYLLFWNGGGCIFVGMLNRFVYQICWLANLLAMGVVLSDFRLSLFVKNGALGAFLLFLGYYTIAGLCGEGATSELVAYHFRIFRMVVIGLIIGIWTRRVPDGFARLLKTVTIAIFVLSLLYIRYGSWSASAMLDNRGRMVVDASQLIGDESQIKGVFNVNRFALLTTMLLSYIVLLLMNITIERAKRFYKIAGVFCCLVLSIVCIKTGSRNGGAGLIALAWYFLFGTGKLDIGKKMLFAISIGVALSVMVAVFMSGNELRIFQFQTEMEKGGAFEDMGTGRGSLFLNIYNGMTHSERVFGKGVVWYYVPVTGQRLANNAHSMYFDIIIHSGWVGFSLFVLFCVAFLVSARRSGGRKNVAILFWLVWILTGIGEAANIAPSAGYAKYGLGIALAMCSKRRFGNEMEWESGVRHPIWGA